MQLDDKRLRQIALALAAIGLITLFLLSELSKPVEVKIAEIDLSFIGKRVSAKGIVKWKYFTKNTLLFELADGNKIKAVLFSPSSEELSAIKKNSVIVVEGVVKKYKGSLEIVVERVREID